MPATYPVFIPQPFANNAAGSDRNTIPNAPVGTQRASFNLGFPPLTMTPVVAGGKPMLGPDMNGILYMLSSHTVYAQSGQPYRWSSDVASAIGGYAVGTLLGSTDGATLWYNAVAGNTSNPDAGGAGWVAMYSYGITTISGLTGGVRTLSAAEASKGVIILSGTLTANQQINLPVQYRRWLIVNTCTGNFNVTVKTPSGTGVIVPAGGLNGPVEVWCNGINIYNVVAPVNLPIDQAPNGLTIAQRTNAGYLFATYFNQSSGLENFAMTALYADAGDGYLRKISPANVQAQLPISGFPGQVSNGQVPQSAVTQHSAAILANAALTGVPTAPTAAPGTATSQIATTAFVQASQSIGIGQAWTITGKNKGITYTNTTGRPIQVAVTMNITLGGGSVGFIINGATVANVPNGSSSDDQIAFSYIIPPGHTYSAFGFGARSNVLQWAELV
jgi:hypothetical protein